MNSLPKLHNGTSLTGVIDLTAHSISLFQVNELPQNIKDTFMIKNISVSQNLMMFRSMSWEIILFRCINLLVVLTTQKWLDQNHY